MESGFGQNLEGFLIKGNLSLSPAELPLYQGDGSIEGSGTLYINTIREYDVNAGIVIQDILLKDNQIHIPYTGPSDNPTSASFVIDGGIRINNTSNALSLTSGGALTVKGGASFAKQVNVGGQLDVNNNKIVNLALPTSGLDATNKDYVDSVASKVAGNFTTGQVIIADSNGDAIRGFDTLTFDGNLLSIGTPVRISNTQSSSGVSSGALVVNGGIAVGANSTINGTLNMGGNSIIQLAYPTNSTDAASKQYVDQQISNITVGSVTGNFTTGQVIIADSNGNAIRGFDNLTFSNNTLTLNSASNLFINNTNNAIGLGSGGSLTTLGGASFGKNVFIGGELDVNVQNIKNVADPILPLDAANKKYVDSIYIDVSNTLGNIFTLNNNVLVPEDVTGFTFAADIQAFVSYIYVYGDFESCSLYTIKGINRNGNWYINKTFIGKPSNITFFISSLMDGSAQIQYTNKNISGSSYIKYFTQTEITDLPTLQNNQINESLTYTNTLLDIPGLQFNSTLINANLIIINVSSLTDNKYSLYFIECVYNGVDWISNTSYFGNVSNIQFTVTTSGNDASVQYLNLNNTNDYVVRCQQIQMLTSQPLYTLHANTNVPTIIDQTLSFTYDQSSFTLSIYATAPSVNKSAIYEIDAFFCDDIWKWNTKFTGDVLDINFNILSYNYTAFVMASNPNNYDIQLSVSKISPNESLGLKAIPISKGGTGTPYLPPYSVLRGNGTNPILATSDFIYKDSVLKLGSDSSIYISNDSSAVNLTTGGTISTLGGITVRKNAIIGQQLVVNSVDVTPNIDDISREQVFLGVNNQTIPSDIVGFKFGPQTKSFSGMLCITVKTTSVEYDMLYDIKGLKKNAGWMIDYNVIGDNLLFNLSITALGQVQYTSPNVINWTETEMRFRAMTTSTSI